jgi:general secretion pathway protein E
MPEQRALGNILIRHGVVSAEALEPLYAQQRGKPADLLDLVVQSRAASEDQILRALASECGMQFVERVDVEMVPTQVGARLPIGYSKAHKLLVVSEEDTHVEVVCSDPLDTDSGGGSGCHQPCLRATGDDERAPVG